MPGLGCCHNIGQLRHGDLMKETPPWRQLDIGPMLALAQTGKGDDFDVRRRSQRLECIQQGLAATPSATGLLPEEAVLGADNQGGWLRGIVHAAIVRGAARLRTFDLAQIPSA